MRDTSDAQTYLRRGLVGASIGAAFGVIAYWRQGHARSDVLFGLIASVAFCAWPGAIAAMILWRLRIFATRGAWAYYVSWIVACTIPMGAFFIPDAIREKSLNNIAFGLFLGLCAGAQMAAFTRAAGVGKRP